MSDERLEEADEPMTVRAKLVAAAVLLAVLLGALLLLMRLGSPAISVSRTAPTGHYPLPCAFCHTMTPATATIGTP